MRAFPRLSRGAARHRSWRPGAFRAPRSAHRRRCAPSAAVRAARPTAIGPLTLPLMITWPRLAPCRCTRAFSLITRMLGLRRRRSTSPCTSPSMRRPSVKRSSPWITVPSPIRVRIGGCFFLPNMACLRRASAVPASQLDGLRGAHAAAVVHHPDLHRFYHGLRGVVEHSFDAARTASTASGLRAVGQRDRSRACRRGCRPACTS